MLLKMVEQQANGKTKTNYASERCIFFCKSLYFASSVSERYLNKPKKANQTVKHNKKVNRS